MRPPPTRCEPSFANTLSTSANDQLARASRRAHCFAAVATKKNQRRYPRVKPKAMSSRVRVAGALHLGLPIENLSLGGAFIRCAHNPPLRSHASLELGVPGLTHPLLLTGQVTFVVSPADAVAKRVPSGFAIQFQQPLPGHVQKGLEQLLRSVDARALQDEHDEPQTDPTQAVPAFVPGAAPARETNHELLALRKLVALHEQELERLKKENVQLRTLVRQLQSR